jgi:hypothetical protein
MKRAEWAFPALLVVLVVAASGVVPLPRGRRAADSFGADGGGKKAFFDLASRLLPDVHRSSQRLVPEDPDADVIVLLGPARYPDRAQWQSLHQWVSDGNALLFAARWQDPAVDLGPFDVSLVPRLGEDGEDAESRGKTETDHISGEVDWRTLGEVRFENEDAWVQLSVDGSPQVVWLPVGSGAIVVAASDYVFTNRSLTKENNGLLAFRILETTAPDGTIYFDEALNEAGAPRVVGLLFEPPFRAVVVQLLAVTLLFAWMTSRRFGPIRYRGRVERRSLVEHAEALGVLHYRARTGARLVASYLEHFRRELGLRHGRAGSMEADTEEVARFVRAAKSPSLERERVAAMITSLARLRQDRAGAKGA